MTGTYGIAAWRHPLADIMIMTGRSSRHILRSVDNILVAAVLPVLIMLLMTTVFGGAIDPGGRTGYVDYVVPGVVLMCAGYGASMTAMSVAHDLKEGIIARFRSMDVLPSAVLFGHVAASVLRTLVSVSLVMGTAMLIGFRPRGTAADLLAAGALLVGFVVAISWLMAMLGMLAKTVEGSSLPGFLLLFIPYLSSAFVPIDTLPDWLQPIATHQPITPINETLRGLLLAGPVDRATPAVIWCLGITVVAAAGAALLWRHRRQ